MAEGAFIRAVRDRFAEVRSLAERAIGQLDEERLTATLGPDENSVAILMQHVGGNLRSRWTAFRTEDGEKPDRHRDREFDTQVSLGEVRAVWQAGWAALDAALADLDPADLDRRITIRAQPLSVTEALLRSLAHTAGHVYQIVQLARHWRGSTWETLSIPRGQSAQFAQNLTARYGTGSKVPDASSR